MKKLTTSQMTAAGAVAALVVAGAAWLGLSSYAASVAEEGITEALTKIDIPRSSYSWSSLSSSPLGGVITIKEFKLDHDTSSGRGYRYASFHADRLVLKGFNNESLPEEASILLEGVEIPSVTIDERERNNLKRVIDNSPLMALAASSGRSSLAPFDLQLEWKMDDESVTLSWATTQPELLRAGGTQLITGPIARLRTLLTPDNIAATPGLALFGEVGEAASQLGLSEIELELEELGAMERANRLRTRYEIANGRAENSEESHAGFMAETRSLCERDLQAAFINDDACERLAEFAAAERDSLQFSAVGTRPLTFDEFMMLDRRGPEYLRTEFKPKLK